MNKGIKHITRTLTLAAFALAALASCTWEENVVQPDPVRVLLAYVGTDNNLAGYEQEKLAVLREGWTGRSTDRIIAYVDKANAPARLIEISNLKDGDQPREIATYGTENSASAATFGRVIADVVDLFPADSYGLFVFSHASGWLPEGTLYNPSGGTKTPPLSLSAATAAAGKTHNGSDPEQATYSCGGVLFDSTEVSSRSIIIDGRYGDTGIAENEKQSQSAEGVSSRSIIIDGTDEMTLTAFANAIPYGVFDYIALEACHMAGIEVAYALRDKTPVILASSAEIVHPGFEPIYPEATAELMGGNLVAFAMSAFSQTISYADTSPIRSATYSVIHTERLDALAAFIKLNCDFSTEIGADNVQHFDRNSYHLFFDFEDYYGRLLPDEAKRAELAQLVAACVDWKAATPEFLTQQNSRNGFIIDKHSGFTTYITQTAFAGLNAAYAQTAWCKAINE